MVARLPTKLEMLFLQSSQLLGAAGTCQTPGTASGERRRGALRSSSARKHLTKGFHMWSKVLTADRPSGIFRRFGGARGGTQSSFDVFFHRVLFRSHGSARFNLRLAQFF